MLKGFSFLTGTGLEGDDIGCATTGKRDGGSRLHNVRTIPVY